MARRIGYPVALILSLSALGTQTVLADQTQVARGKYLVQLGGCTDCHTPGHFFGKPDMARYLAGSDVGLQGPDGSVVVGPNLTPDNDTGIGRWTVVQIVTAITSGVRPDGRVLSPLMPWGSLHNLTPTDATAIALFLKSLPPVHHEVAGPFTPKEKVPLARFVLLPPPEPPQVSR